MWRLWRLPLYCFLIVLIYCQRRHVLTEIGVDSGFLDAPCVVSGLLVWAFSSNNSGVHHPVAGASPFLAVFSRLRFLSPHLHPPQYCYGGRADPSPRRGNSRCGLREQMTASVQKAGRRRSLSPTPTFGTGRVEWAGVRFPRIGASRFAPLNPWKTSNTQHPTSNTQGPAAGQALDVGCSMLVVGCSSRFMGRGNEPAESPVVARN
jgi:hypothetical protein